MKLEFFKNVGNVDDFYKLRYITINNISESRTWFVSNDLNETQSNFIRFI